MISAFRSVQPSAPEASPLDSPIETHMPPFRAAFLAFAAILSTSCSNPGSQPPFDSELEIRVTRGPIEPVQRDGEENEIPAAHARVTVQQRGGRRVAQVETDDSGHAIVAVVSGDYALEVSGCPVGTMFSKGAEVVVRAGERAQVHLICDTGIR
jgi:hypothetical protein